MNKRIKKILAVADDCDYKKLSIEDLLHIKEYINNLEDGNKSLLEHIDYMQENNNKLIDIVLYKQKELEICVDEIERLNNIIKEVREYIEKHIHTLGPKVIPSVDFNFRTLLDILYKENKQ